MAQITAKAVAELREKTGAGMMECKKALTEADGNLDEAVTILRKRLGAKVGNREGRAASEGLVMAHVRDDRRVGVLVELNSETDFVARNEAFKELAQSLAAKIAAYGPGTVPTSLDALLADTMNGTATVQDVITEAAGRIGEKLVLGRFERFGAPEGNVVSAYVHNPGGSGDAGGKIGVLVEMTGAAEDALATLGREIALHIASARPKYLSEADVSAETMEQEREIARAQAANDPKMAGKPEKAIEAMVTGRVRKVLEETVLLSQPYVREPGKSITALVKETAGASIVRFARFQVGESQAKPAGGAD